MKDNSMYLIVGKGASLKFLKLWFILIFISVETVLILISGGTRYFNSLFNEGPDFWGQLIIIIFFVTIYYVGASLIKKEGKLEKNAYGIKIFKDRLEIREPHKEVTIKAEDIEAIKYGRITNSIFFRFKDFIKYAKEYGLNDYQISIMQKKRYYWVGNNLPYLTKEERKKFKKALDEFKRVNGIE